MIEFAVCIPVLIILLYYINDLSKLKRWHDQTEFVAQQMVNIFQNISQNRTDKKITAPDIKHAVSLAYLSIFPGKTEFLTKAFTSDLGYHPMGFIFCVKGNPDSTASVLWGRKFHMAYKKEFSPTSVTVENSGLVRTNVKILSNADPSEIYPTLKIGPGDMKIIIECGIHYSRSNYAFTDGRKTANVSYSRAFRLHSYKLSPPILRDGFSNADLFFHSVAIFTPAPGLFDETAPK